MKKLINNLLAKGGFVITKTDNIDNLPFLHSAINVLLENTQLQQNVSYKELIFNEINSFEQYSEYVSKMQLVYQRRQKIEELVALPKASYYLAGYNALIGKNVNYQVTYSFKEDTLIGIQKPNFRELLICPRTYTNSRMRASVLALFYKFNTSQNLKKKKLYLTEKLTSLYKYFETICDDLTGSEYINSSLKPGQMINGVRHEDITQLSFQNNIFDIIVSLEVLEHVPSYLQGFKELYRCLKPNGVLLLTVPFNVNVYNHIIRATINTKGEIEHLLPPEYHGDPMNVEGGILCYQHFGWKLLDELREVGFKEVKSLFVWSLYHGILGNDIMVIYATK